MESLNSALHEIRISGLSGKYKQWNLLINVGLRYFGNNSGKMIWKHSQGYSVMLWFQHAHRTLTPQDKISLGLSPPPHHSLPLPFFCSTKPVIIDLVTF